MNTSTKLPAYAVVLVAAFGAAAGLGSAVGPIDAGAAEPGHGDGHAGTDSATEGAAATAGSPGGLMVAQDGYALALAENSVPAGGATPLAFRVLGPDGAPVTDYEVTHDEDLHLIVVRRDMTGFQHVHPELAEDGTWSIPLALSPGQWRVFADFAPAGNGDLAYLHVHPGGEPGDGVTEPGPRIIFYANVPNVGDYRLFLDFQHDGVVRTAEFTARAGPNQ